MHVKIVLAQWLVQWNLDQAVQILILVIIIANETEINHLR